MDFYYIKVKKDIIKKYPFLFAFGIHLWKYSLNPIYVTCISCSLYNFNSYLKYLRNILIPIHHPVNLYILVSNLIQHYIIPANYILIIRPEADSLSKIRYHIGKLLYILKSGIYLLNGFYCHFLSSSTLIQAPSSLTASSASCSFMSNFFSAFSRS